MNKNVKSFNSFFTDKEKSIILHSLTVYLEKLDFVFKNSNYYDVDYFTIKSLQNDYDDILLLREKLFSIPTIEYSIKNSEGS